MLVKKGDPTRDGCVLGNLRPGRGAWVDQGIDWVRGREADGGGGGGGGRRDADNDVEPLTEDKCRERFLLRSAMELAQPP